MDRYLDEENYSGITVDDDLRGLLKRMLSLDPEKRISPRQIVEFLGSREQLNIPFTVVPPPVPPPASSQSTTPV
jgi:hypothetical protein